MVTKLDGSWFGALPTWMPTWGIVIWLEGYLVDRFLDWLGKWTGSLVGCLPSRLASWLVVYLSSSSMTPSLRLISSYFLSASCHIILASFSCRPCTQPSFPNIKPAEIVPRACSVLYIADFSHQTHNTCPQTSRLVPVINRTCTVLPAIRICLTNL